VISQGIIGFNVGMLSYVELADFAATVEERHILIKLLYFAGFIQVSY
jgi:hypothetical protein